MLKFELTTMAESLSL